MLGRIGKAPGFWSKAALCVLAFLVFALATYARVSWYRQDCLEKTYLVKSVKLMDNRARTDIDLPALPAAEPAIVKEERDERPYWWPVAVEPSPALCQHTYDPAYFRPPPAIS